MSVSKTWKSVEGRIAKYWGTTRTPLSGINSKHTSSDTLHKDYFIEIKHRKEWAIFNLFKRTRELANKEKKLPFLCLHEKNKAGFLICIHSDDFREIVRREFKNES